MDCTVDAEPAPFLGVSPPLRSGACNPLAHHAQWQQQAQQASKLARSSLEALQGGRTAGAVLGGGQCRGDYRLLLSPPEATGVLAAYCVDEPCVGRTRSSSRNGGSWHSGRAGSLSPGPHIFG